MSDLSQTVHNFETMLAGKSTFSQFAAQEGAMIEKNIASLPPAMQGAATVMFESFKAGASILVGAGMTAIGPILAESSDTQATQIANLLQLMGVKTVGPLSIAEHAALVTAINGLKAQLDRIGLQITTSGVQAKP